MATVERFDYVFLGGGKGGKTLAVELAKAGKRVAVVERGMIGGSCINVACIPTKSLIQTARLMHAAREAERLGATPQVAQTGRVDMKRVYRRVRSVVDGMVDINLTAFKTSGMDLMIGNGRFIAPRTIEVTLANGEHRVVEGEHAFINTGTTAAIPDIDGLRDAAPLTHVEALELETLPEHLIVFGGGYIGLEMAQAFRRLGSRVTVLQEAPRVAMREDPDVAAAITAALEKDDIDVRVNTRAVKVEGRSGHNVHIALADGSALDGTHILVAAGRTPNTRGIGLEEAGVKLDARGFIVTDARLATSAPNTWAIGEVAGTPMFTHASFDDYRVLKSNLAGGTYTTNDRVIPYALFIEPELARIGLNETDAAAKGIKVRVATLPMAAVPRARTNQETDGFMKALVAVDSDEILGFTMLGAQAGEVVSAVQMAMLGKLPYTAVRDAILSHPTIGEGLNLLFAKVPPRA
ncbi:FAD-dependent oxidoreductase [Paraburkholderia rhizosphaerae]|uniref:Pyruvate/2-oxoglutarate dehydrogenase complex dihydrolipoamide dehydrogenase (E3) component n=1 Tax=Paraburkholderia rhizosphaerae TaxID=480658 RepID=A0A4R8L9Z8_9BURK|nr:FAD-dependent oxidoreductase [Paraburkholderia rhizosphaerae]TDY39008.1 pyruvate/2-oxoglutarate dehydrogenase complex dihydrolipoamide dehydrogenase (E3) component [Paraburkholderia rhizosphaerae]